MRYSWDERKNRSNIAKHAVALNGFSKARLSKKSMTAFDYGEVRVYAIGLVNGREITVVYTDENNEERRIISAWRSEPHERRFFWTNVEG